MNQRFIQQIDQHLTTMLDESRLELENQAMQHGDTTVLLHSMAVTYYSLMLAELLHIRYDQKSLIRGALLHDYFLYDWHVSNPTHRFHGLYHAKTALQNAKIDFVLTEKERDIILHHMFPLNLPPPRCREAIVVCAVDKVCGIYEMLKRGVYPGLNDILNRHMSCNRSSFINQETRKSNEGRM